MISVLSWPPGKSGWTVFGEFIHWLAITVAPFYAQFNPENKPYFSKHSALLRSFKSGRKVQPAVRWPSIIILANLAQKPIEQMDLKSQKMNELREMEKRGPAVNKNSNLWRVMRAGRWMER